MRTAPPKDCHGLPGVSGARQRSDGVEKYSSIASRQAPEHGSTASSLGPDSKISAAIFSAQLMQTPARSIPQAVQLQIDLRDVSEVLAHHGSTLAAARRAVNRKSIFNGTPIMGEARFGNDGLVCC